MKMFKRGYTLLELLITIGVLALLTAFAIPTYQLVMSQFQLSEASQTVETLIRSTQQKTVSEQKIYGITFTTNAQTVIQYLYNTTNGTKTTQKIITFPGSIKIGSTSFSGQSDIQFNTAGSPNYSGYVVVNDPIRNRNRKVELKPSGSIIGNQAEY